MSTEPRREEKLPESAVTAAPRSEATTAPTYYSGTYADGHFALATGDKGEAWYVATVRCGEHRYMVKLNPSDARGLRAIVVLQGVDMRQTLNRPYTLCEKQGLGAVLMWVAHAYDRLGMCAQMEIAGNNAHSFESAAVGGGGGGGGEEEKKKNAAHFVIGNAKEPGMLHGHVIGRADPSARLPGMQNSIGGPPPGCLFNMRGDGADEGNRSKTLWTGADMRLFAAQLAATLVRLFAAQLAATLVPKIDGDDALVAVRIERTCI
jgi:hypothetical protein